MIVDPIDSQDVVSRWLQAAENDGESMAILLGCGSVSTLSIDWRFYSHLHYDGIGAFARALANAHSVPIPMPIGSFPPAGWTARSLPALAPQPVLSESASRPESSTCAVPELVEKGLLAWHHFSLDASQAICAHARHKQCTVNSRLLYSLHQSLLKKEHVGPHFNWLIPVNLRGALSPLRRAYSNQVSSILYSGSRLDSLEETQRAVHGQLARGEHWQQYRRMRSLCRLPLWMRTWILKRQRLKQAIPTGTFSNLGAWDASTSLEKDHFWLFCPPLASHHQVAAGCLCFQNQISLVLRLAPDSPLAERPAKHWMQSWRDSLIQQ